MNDTLEKQSLDTYIKNVENQEIKGILLKLKNEMRKSDVSWEAVKSILSSLEQKDANCAKDIFSLLIND